MATIASLSVNLFAETARLQRDLAVAQQANRRYVNRTRSLYAGLASSLTSLRFGLGALFAGAGGAAIVNATNQLVQVRNLLGASGVNANELEDALAGVQAISESTFTSFRDTGRLFAVLNRNSERLGATQEQVLVATRAIQQSFQLSGANAGEAAGAVTQLSQALASGVLRGQELNSVAEQAPLLFAAIANNLDVSFGELRRLAAEGMVTSQEVLDAIIRAAPEFQRQFQEINPTFQQLGQLFQTEILPPLAELGQRILPAFGQALSVASALVSLLVDNLDALLGVGRVLGSFLIAVLANRAINGVIRSFITLRASTTAIAAAWGGLSMSAIRLAAQSNNVGFAMFRLTGSIRAATIASTVFRRAVLTLSASLRVLRTALFSLGGPLGLILIALTEIGLAVYNYFSPAVQDAGDDAEEFAGIMDQINSAIDDLPEVAREAASGVNVLGTSFEATRATANALLVRIGEISQAEFDRIRDLEQADALWKANLITTEQFRRAILTINDEFEETNNMLSELGQTIQRSLEDSLVDAFETGRFAFQDLARDILREIIRIQIRLATTRFLSGIGLPGLQNGGPARAGQAYIVGEAGPELFIPDTNGNVVSNTDLQGAGGGGGGEVTYNINAVDARSFQQLVAADPAFIANVATRGQRIQGGLRR